MATLECSSIEEELKDVFQGGSLNEFNAIIKTKSTHLQSQRVHFNTRNH